MVASKAKTRPADDRFELRGPPEALVGVLMVTAPTVETSHAAVGLGILEAARAWRRSGGDAPAELSPDRLRAFEIDRPDAAQDADLGSARLIESELPTQAGPPGILHIGHVEPGETRAAPVSYAVGPRTPPGTYTAIFQVGGAPRRATITVLPVERLALHPGRVSLRGVPGATVVEPMVLENAGNIDIAVGGIGRMVTEEREQICLSLQEAMAQTDSDGWRGFMDGFFSSLSQRKTGTILVGAKGRNITLAPGEARSVPVAFRLPSDMQPGRRYTAELPAWSSSLFAEIDVLGVDRASAEPEEAMS